MPLMIDPGNLDRQIVIEQATEVQDEYGKPVETWAAFATVWAEKRDVTGRERFVSKQELASRVTVFRIRYLSGVSPEMRIQCEGAVYDIEAIAELGRRTGLEITATAEPV